MKPEIIFLNMFVIVSCYELKQVLILSRHNIRAPLTEDLINYTSNSRTEWNSSAGALTQKGALLEEYLGGFIHEWLVREQLLGDECPDQNSVFVHSNTIPRSRESARAFVRGAFANCSIRVFTKDSDGIDPIFDNIVRNSSVEVKEVLVKEIQEKLNRLDLRRSLLVLTDILNFKYPETCKNETLCGFDGKHIIFYEVGYSPAIIGPLLWGLFYADAFLMSYYEGHSLENVAWGKVRDTERWMALTHFLREYQNVTLNSMMMGRQVAKPLLCLISSIFNQPEPIKFTLLHGHDINLCSVMAALAFKEYLLPDQFENTPIGGKLVFQKWYDDVRNRYLLRIDYVYLTVSQIRHGLRPSLSNPPQSVQMFLKDCLVDAYGLCPWEQFIKILGDAASF